MGWEWYHSMISFPDSCTLGKIVCPSEVCIKPCSTVLPEENVFLYTSFIRDLNAASCDNVLARLQGVGGVSGGFEGGLYPPPPPPISSSSNETQTSWFSGCKYLSQITSMPGSPSSWSQTISLWQFRFFIQSISVLHTDCTLPLCKLIRYPSSVPGEMEAVIFPDSYFQPFTNP